MTSLPLITVIVSSATLMPSSPRAEFERLWQLATNPAPYSDVGRHVLLTMNYEQIGGPSATVVFEVWKHGGIYRIRQDTSGVSQNTMDYAIDEHGNGWKWSEALSSSNSLTIFEPGLAAPRGVDFTKMQGQFWSQMCAFDSQGLSLIRNWPELPTFIQSSDHSFAAHSSIPDADLRIVGTLDPLRILSIIQSGKAAGETFQVSVTNTWQGEHLTAIQYELRGHVRKRFTLHASDDISRDFARRMATVPSDSEPDPIRTGTRVNKIDDARGDTRRRSRLDGEQRVVLDTDRSRGNVVRSATRYAWMGGLIVMVVLLVVRHRLKGQAS
ncbi:MAG: hypothetical protein IT438_04630 [Phycisphaerales bacterium]|nr:hypothetical protein [Phycisphaerales bacterium]